ncbi:MAG: preprotein translocase subunit SecY, partial [Geobacteraceae bacterium]|nr:preprotein translocase subunit SecY [Geobacteraceae bacterium]
MFEALQNIFKIPELKKRVLFSLGMLAVYRVGCHIPTPGIDRIALAHFFKQSQGTLLGLFDMFSGGALERLTVFALGIMPYISSSIIFQLLTVVIPAIEKLSKEGESGRKKIIQYTRYGTVVLSIVQGMGVAVGLESMRGPAGELVVPSPGWGFRVLTVITLTAGTAFVMWLGEQMSEKGIGNGISLIIFAGIVVNIPSALVNTTKLVNAGQLSLFVLI